MVKLSMSRLHNNLDMITSFSVKKHKLSTINTIVFVNSGLFLQSRNEYALQNGDVRYVIKGMIEKAWGYLEAKKYNQANQIFDTILLYSTNSSDTYFGKFIVMLFQDKEAYSYLKKAIETKYESSKDDYFRLYLKLYTGLIDISEDYLPLVELLDQPKKILAFNKSSYNGNYLEFIRLINNDEFNDAKSYLKNCLEMKPNELNLIITQKLLDMVVEHTKEVEEYKKKQEQELETFRCQNFAVMVKQNDFNAARKELERILSYRENEEKDNYIYYLFLELLETIQIASEDITFEIMPITYEYTRPEEHLYTFFEAIAIGDFYRALEAGKKCKGKLLDRDQPAIKVNVYLQLLESLFNVLQERQKEMENIYQIIQNNILRGNYKHALELYNIHFDGLKNFQEQLIKDLFDKGISEEEKKPIVIEEYEIEEQYELEEDELEEIPEEIVNQDILEEEEELFFSTVPEETHPIIEDKKVAKPIVTNLYQVQPLLQHMESQHEFFLNYQECLNNNQHDAARMWLAKFDRLLKENNLHKRISQHFYRITVAIAESKDDMLKDKEYLYREAYNAMMNKEYDTAISYLDAYLELDAETNTKGYILLARIYTLMGDSEQAIHNYIRANAISPDPDAYYFLGELYFKKRKWNDAIFCYLAYNEFYPRENVIVYINLSECYKRMGKTNKVVKYLRIAEEINIEQKKGLYLKNRILKAEMLDKKKREHFRLQKGVTTGAEEEEIK